MDALSWTSGYLRETKPAPSASDEAPIHPTALLVIDVAEELFALHAYNGTSIRDITAKASELIDVEELITEPTVERLDRPVVCWLSRPRVVQLHTTPPDSFDRPVVGSWLLETHSHDATDR